MGRYPLKIGVLTSSRADYGIYRPLLKKLHTDSRFDLNLIVFGSHLSKDTGPSINNILADGYSPVATIPSLLQTDDPESIAISYGFTAMRFAPFWEENSNHLDYVFCLGDRFEMAAAVFSAIPFGVKFIHLHGGEKTEGAFDEVYRHSITLASILHFTSTKEYAQRVAELTGTDDNVFVSGSLGIENLLNTSFPGKSDFLKQFDVPNRPYILVTVHPETRSLENIEQQMAEITRALKQLSEKFHIVITMPNNDTFGSRFRVAFRQLKNENPNHFTIVNNFGTKYYAAAMKYAQCLLGNSSSAIIEAASFGKYVVNIGDRQKGRIAGNNVLNCLWNHHDIVETTARATKLGAYHGNNPYFISSQRPSDFIVNKLIEFYERGVS